MYQYEGHQLMETTGSNAKDDVFTQQELEMVQEYCRITREEIIRLANKMLKHMPRPDPVTGKLPESAGLLAKAYDIMQHAAKFCNVVDSHTTYAYEFYAKATEQRDRTGRAGDTSGGDDVRPEDVGATASSDSAEGQGCSLLDQSREDELLLHDASGVLETGEALLRDVALTPEVD